MRASIRSSTSWLSTNSICREAAGSNSRAGQRSMDSEVLPSQCCMQQQQAETALLTGRQARALGHTHVAPLDGLALILRLQTSNGRTRQHCLRWAAS